MPRSARLSALRTIAVAAIAFASVRAEADDAADAKALFDQGRALVKADNHADACPLFEQSLRLDPALGTELNLALCWAKIGKLVGAERLFDHVIEKLAAPDQAPRRAIAEKGKADVAGRMPRLQIDRTQLPAQTEVRVDGEVVDVSEPIAVDPGAHAITAEGAHAETVTATEGEVTKVTLREVVVVVAPPPVAPPPAPKRTFLYVGGAGVAMLLVGTVTGVLTLSKKSSGLDKCDDTGGTLVCTPAGSSDLDAARAYSHVTTGLFVVGAALVATGVVLKLRQPSPDQATVTGWVSGTSAGFAWGRAW